MHDPSSPPLAGRTAVVTGSTSGIGQAIAVALADAGADVLVHGKSNFQGAQQTCELVAERRRSSIIVLADLAEQSGCAALVEEAWQWRRGVDVWVNNAGVDVLTGAAAALSFDDKLATLWQVDVAATLRLSRAVGRRMVDRGGAPGEAAIVNLGWDQAELGMAGDSGELFATVKGAVMAFTRSLAKSLAPTVRVNCVAPGWIETAWGQHASAYWRRRAAAEALLARWGQPADVARAVRFLASPEAAFITGQTLAVNGGFAGSWREPAR